MLSKSVHKPILFTTADCGLFKCHETIFTLIDTFWLNYRDGASPAADGGG
jgi:hypothetical protein